MSLPESMTLPGTWNLVAPGYAAEVAPAFARFAEDALELAHLVPGESVLDVGTGPGTLALAAACSGARVAALDFSPRMIAELQARAAREGVAGIAARIGDATAMPYENNTFDAVFSMFALNLMADRGADFREIRRVLRRGARAVVGTPTSLARVPVFGDIHAIVRAAIPGIDFDGELPLSEPAELEEEARAAGFSEIAVRSVTQSLAYASVAAIWAMATRAAAPIVVAREAMDAERWSRASEQIVRALEQRFGTGPERIDITVNLAYGRK
jgi:cyclopropane fatty-acyl-phospholipid synthase-like methyltransferase